jgi:hypothetical protein
LILHSLPGLLPIVPKMSQVRVPRQKQKRKTATPPHSNHESRLFYKHPLHESFTPWRLFPDRTGSGPCIPHVCDGLNILEISGSHPSHRFIFAAQEKTSVPLTRPSRRKTAVICIKTLNFYPGLEHISPHASLSTRIVWMSTCPSQNGSVEASGEAEVTQTCRTLFILDFVFELRKRGLGIRSVSSKPGDSRTLPGAR